MLVCDESEVVAEGEVEEGGRRAFGVGGCEERSARDFDWCYRDQARYSEAGVEGASCAEEAERGAHARIRF